MKLPDSLRWKYIRELGDGGQGLVAIVGDMRGDLKTRHALKRLKNGQSQKAYQRFVQEIEAINKLDHPNIIKIVDHSDPSDEFQFYVMEYFEGALPLKELIGTDRNPFYKNPEAAIDLFCQLCSAIEVWRGARIVHRDLSPANILVLPDKSIKVIDFGICQAEDGESVTLSEEGLGTRNYTAPECEAGAEKEITILADFYSAGKVLWSAITNKNAFAREADAFKSKSMESMFPDDPRIWHLQHIFRYTIRGPGRNRFSSGEFARQFATDVKRLVTGGFMPLPWLREHFFCPACGWGQLEEFRAEEPIIAGTALHPEKRTIQSLRCNYCGICMSHDRSMMEKRLKEFENLS